MIARFEPEYIQEHRDQIIIETIIAIHRSRGEVFQDNRIFYIIHNPENHEEVVIGFVESSVENLFKWLEPGAIKVSDEIMNIVREALT